MAEPDHPDTLEHDAPDPSADGQAVSLRAGLRGRWQIPLLVLGVILLLAGLPRLVIRPAAPDAGEVLALADRLAAEGQYSQSAQVLNGLLAEPAVEELTDAQRARALQLRSLAAYRLADTSADASIRRDQGRSMLADLDEAIRLVGGPESLDPSLWPPLELHARRGRVYRWLSRLDKCEADLLAALALVGDDPARQPIRRQLILDLWDVHPPTVRRELDAMLARDDLPADLRVWALLAKSRLLAEEDHVAEAMRLLAEQRDRLPAGSPQDAADVQIARICYQTATDKHAATDDGQRGRLLDRAMAILQSVAERREPVAGEEDLDAELAWLTGEVNYLQGRPVAAAEAFDRLVRHYSRTAYYRSGLLGVAKSAALYRRYDEALVAYRRVVAALDTDDPLIDRPAVGDSLLALYEQLKSQDQWEPAYRFLVLLEQILDDHQGPLLLQIKEKQGAALEKLAVEEKRQADRRAADSRARRLLTTTQPDPEESRLSGQAKRHFVMAAEAFLEAAHLAAKDERRSGQALQLAADCFDQAGEIVRSITVLKRFIEEHPGDRRRIAWAMFNLAKAYQAAALYEKAIEQFTQLIAEFAKTPAANKSLVPMAQCHKALGQFDQAEAILNRLLADDETFRPDSAEFTEALIELAKLKYERGQYRDAIGRLDEALQRYPDHPQALYCRYYLADSYRRSGLVLDKAIASARTLLERQQLLETRGQWLRKARTLFDETVALFEARGGPDGDLDTLDWLYLRNAYFFRADCLFDLAQYEEAIWLYDLAALKYQGQPEALAAYVQIVNCYFRLGRPEQARTANERARWLLKKLPADGFLARPLPLSKVYFDQWLAWTGGAELW